MFTSTAHPPCPDVAASNQFPERAKSALVEFALVVSQVTFCVRRFNGIVPRAPGAIREAVRKLTARARVEAQRGAADQCPVVTGGALKLPPVF